MREVGEWVEVPEAKFAWGWRGQRQLEGLAVAQEVAVWTVVMPWTCRSPVGVVGEWWVAKECHWGEGIGH